MALKKLSDGIIEREPKAVYNRQQEGSITDEERLKLVSLMKTYEMGILRQSQALAEAANRGLFPVLMTI